MAVIKKLHNVKVREAVLEAHLVKKVRAIGGIAEKAVYLTKAGAADRWCFLPGGRLYLVEVKTEHGRLSAQQKIERDRMLALGFDFNVVWSEAEIDALIERMKAEAQ